MKKTLSLIASAILFCSVTAQAQYESFRHIGVSAGVGTEGIIIDATTNINKYLDLRAGVDFFPKFSPKFDVNFKYQYFKEGASKYEYVEGEDKMQSKITAATGRLTGHVMVDVYPFVNMGATFFITAGVSFGKAQILDLSGYSEEIERFYIEKKPAVDQVKVEVGNTTLDVDKNGNTVADLRGSSVRPYLGLGFGRVCRKGRGLFRFELVAYYHGKPQLYYNGNDVLDDVIADVTNDSVRKLLQNARKVPIYPVLKFALNVRIL